MSHVSSSSQSPNLFSNNAIYNVFRRLVRALLELVVLGELNIV